MAFDDRDAVVTEPEVVDSSTIEKIEFVRDRSLSGVKVEIRVTKRVIKGGREVFLIGKVPQSKVDAGWTTGTKTLKNQMLFIIDNAEF